MPLLPNIDGLLADTQQAHADALDLVEICAHAQHGNPVDPHQIMAIRRRLAAYQAGPLASTVTLLAGMLANTTVIIGQAYPVEADQAIAAWRRLAALAVDVQEASLTGDPGRRRP